MFVVDLATSATHRIRPEFVAALHPIWSPDGKHILFDGLQKPDDEDRSNGWWVTPLYGGTPVMFGQLITEESSVFLYTWRQDTIYLTDDSVSPTGVGQIGINPVTFQPVGKVRRLTTGTTNEDSPSVSKDGRLVFSSLIQNTNLYTVPFPAAKAQENSDTVRLTRDEGEDLAGSLSSDGERLAFSSRKTGNEEVWTRDMSTGQERQLTFGGTRPRIDPLISPSGELVAWRENYVRNPVVILTPFAGGSSRKTCSSCAVAEAWTPDNKVLLYRSGPLAQSAIGLFHLESGDSTTFMTRADVALRADSLTSDGRWMLFTVFRAKQEYAIYAAPFATTRAPDSASWIELLRSGDSDPNPVWSRDGKTVVFSSSRDGFNCIWGLRVDDKTKQPTGAIFPIRHFHFPSLELTVPGFHQRPVLGANQMIISLRESSGSIWMMKIR
jgi:Tol biopolymer transport system component